MQSKVRVGVTSSDVARSLAESLEVRRSHFKKGKEDGSNQNGPTSEIENDEDPMKHERVRTSLAFVRAAPAKTLRRPDRKSVV